MYLFASFTEMVARWAGRHVAGPEAPVRAFPNIELLEDRTLLSIVFTNEHTDLGVTYNRFSPPFATNHWTLYQIDKETNPFSYYGVPRVVDEVLPKAEQPQTSDPRFAFLGAGAGNPVWIIPINPRDPDLLQLGVSGESIPPGTFASYKETDPRLNGDFPFPWVKMNVVDVRGPGYFSVYLTDEFGNPTVWVATSPGGNSNPNVLFTATAGHVDYNWAFTAPGDYYIGIEASAYLPDFTPTHSRIYTYHFQVDPVGPSASSGQADGASVGATALAQVVEGGALSGVAKQTTIAALSPFSPKQLATPAQASASLDQLVASNATDHESAWSPSLGQVHAGTDSWLGDGSPDDSQLSAFAPLVY
jgi:surface-anchored protein